MARFQRARGRDVRLVTGTDEHGLKMFQTARDQGRATIELADEMSGYFREMYAKLNISYDVFMRTSDTAHHAASQAIWKAMEANGDLYLRSEEHTSELQSLMRISYAVFCLKKKKNHMKTQHTSTITKITHTHKQIE